MESVLSFLTDGLTGASWWQIVLFTLVVTHITIVAVTVFLHRSQAHRGLDLHPIASHFFRFWLWMTTGMVTKQWVAIHRKHHARCEREGDPHSPMVYGINRVLFTGAELYRIEAQNRETMAKFGHGTPDDWMERNVYSRYTTLGIFSMLAIDLALFGVLGLTVWAVQMAWIPFWAAGVVNGIGHFWGYRNYASPDTSTNVSPWGIIIGGEELHNNHHAHATSARFSAKWYEFDIGWMYIRMMQSVGLAKVRRVAPRPQKLDAAKPAADLQTLQAVITHRYEIMAGYADMLKQACREEISRLKKTAPHDKGWHPLRKLQSSLRRGDGVLKDDDHRAEIDSIVAQHGVLATLVQMRNELSRIWESSSASSEKLLHDLQDWCARAQQSGIKQLEDFATRLRLYAA
ncbi:acyl-CoA desaturase [Verticiella sediminum]|uniref:Acyl-CoA desaturase n=1 Tax=Verticiella sediminum TaxID=1247510 RepID=A0A556A6D2_9BURK|nr:fatty acid desaturase [Verticiella sediminum]TSH88432.1 acyl-CoA desaturase [Verticiella sediminum]